MSGGVVTAAGDPSGFPGLTAEEVATRAQLDPRYALALLEDEAARGNLERIGDRFRFTPAGWRAVGRPLAMSGITGWVW